MAYACFDGSDNITDLCMGGAPSPIGAYQFIADDDPRIATFLTTPTNAQLTAALIAQAQALLDLSDRVFLRCGKAGIAWPPEWQTFTESARALKQTGTGTLPSTPAYPTGT